METSSSALIPIDLMLFLSSVWSRVSVPNMMKSITCILHSKLYGNCSVFLFTLAACFSTGLISKFSIQEKQICYLQTFRDKVEDFVAMATCHTQHQLSRDSQHKRLSVRTMARTFGSNCFTLSSQEALRWNPSVSSLSFSARYLSRWPSLYIFQRYKQDLELHTLSTN